MSFISRPTHSQRKPQSQQTKRKNCQVLPSKRRRLLLQKRYIRHFIFFANNTIYLSILGSSEHQQLRVKVRSITLPMICSIVQAQTSA